MKMKVLALAFVASLIPAHVAAQSPDSGCGQRAAKLRSALTGAGFSAAVNRITLCPSEAVPLLSEAWRTPGRDSAELAALRAATLRVRDARLAKALIDVLADQSRPEPVRIAAMLSLAPYYRRCLVTDMLIQDLGKYGKKVRIMVGLSYGDPSRPGGESPSPELPSTTIRTLDEVSTREPNTLIGKATSAYANRLKSLGTDFGHCSPHPEM